MSQSNSVTNILTAIETAANQQIETLLQDANRHQADAITQAKNRATEETAHYKKAAFDAIREETGRNISNAENEARADLFRRREQIRLEVFAKAKEQIRAFTQTPDYESFLIASAQRIHRAMGGNCAVLNMREADTHLATKVTVHLGRSITLHTDPDIELGGITVISADGKMMVDDTLDSRLQDGQRWFMEHSGLVIE